jgi:peptidyl-tRNA hydrolase
MGTDVAVGIGNPEFGFSPTNHTNGHKLVSANSAGATMKLTTTTVKVCSTELDDSRSKESVTDGRREAPPESTTEVRTGQLQ